MACRIIGSSLPNLDLIRPRAVWQKGTASYRCPVPPKATQKGTMLLAGWKAALTHLALRFEGRLEDGFQGDYWDAMPSHYRK